MKRIHAFEFEDLRWFPDNLRNYATDFLQFGATIFDMYRLLILQLNGHNLFTWMAGIVSMLGICWVFHENNFILLTHNPNYL